MTRPPTPRHPTPALPTPRLPTSRPPDIPIFPNQKKTQIDDSIPICPTPKPQIDPSHIKKSYETLTAQMKQLKLDHAKAIKEKDVEIHFLRCTASDSSLETVNTLMAKRNLRAPLLPLYQ